MVDMILERGLQSYIKALVKDAIEKDVNLSKYADAKLLSDEVFRKYFEHVLYLQKNLAKSFCLSSTCQERQTVTELMSDFADKCKNHEFQITIAGRIGSGKSTLINALLGNDIYYTEPYDETSILTKFRYSIGNDYIKVSYYNTEEWDLLWQSVISANQGSIRNDNEGFLSEYMRLGAEEIRIQLLDRHDEIFYATKDVELRDLIYKYSSCKKPYHFFVKEVEIGLSSYSLPKNVVLVDTLGLDDPVIYRTVFGHQYISSASIILLCVKATEAQLRSYELDMISKFFSMVKSKEQVYILGTQYDIPNEFPKYWREKTYPKFIRYISSKSCFGLEEKSKKRLFPVSAWYYNIIQKAKKDAAFERNECDVDYLAEVLCRCLGNSVAYQYGTDSNALKKCMNEHLEELELKTNMPYVIDNITNGPIRDYERKSFEEFKDIYQSIFRKMGKESSQQESLYTSNLRSQLLAFDSKRIKRHKEDETKSSSINAILMSLQNNNYC